MATQGSNPCLTAIIFGASMNKIIGITALALILAGCASNTTRTLPVLVWEDRPLGELVYRERAPLVVPPNYRNPNLNSPREDRVMEDWNKNNFNNQSHVEVHNVPLPAPRPYNLTKPHCDIFKDKDCRVSK